MLDVIDIPVDGCLLLTWADQHGVDSDYPAALTNHPDLFVTDIALDVVTSPRIAVGDDERPGRVRKNIFEARWINVSEINDDAECFALLQQVAPEAGQTIAGGAARRESATRAGRITPDVGESNHPQTEL